ncbi:MAG: SPOR domain-containing protein [Bacteroidales bacterium]|nr:SPOR domain-containing protein [Bacteroidales bacterium]
MKRFLFLYLFLVIASLAFSQNNGSLNVNQDTRIATLIQKQRQIHALDSTFSGYRIHIFMEIGNEALAHAEKVKKQFEEAFPDIPIYLSYSEPYFRLRAGDFRNRVEAEKCLHRIKPQFREAFVTADMVFEPKIVAGNGKSN